MPAQTALPQGVLVPKAQRGSPRRLSEEERALLLNLLLSERFVDASPRQVYAQLLQEGQYHASYRTMYRLLHEHQAVCERRKVRRHPAYMKPELKATGPNQVWTWDITYLKTPVRGRFYYLYVVIDIYSRYVVGWMLADRECQYLAHKLLQETCRKYNIVPGQLTIHADRGGPMKSKPVEATVACVAGEPLAQPPACQQRQSVLGSRVQNDEVQRQLPGALCQPGRRADVLPELLCLV